MIQICDILGFDIFILQRGKVVCVLCVLHSEYQALMTFDLTHVWSKTHQHVHLTPTEKNSTMSGDPGTTYSCLLSVCRSIHPSIHLSTQQSKHVVEGILHGIFHAFSCTNSLPDVGTDEVGPAIRTADLDPRLNPGAHYRWYLIIHDCVISVSSNFTFVLRASLPVTLLPSYLRRVTTPTDVKELWPCQAHPTSANPLGQWSRARIELQSNSLFNITCYTCMHM